MHTLCYVQYRAAGVDRLVISVPGAPCDLGSWQPCGQVVVSEHSITAALMV